MACVIVVIGFALGSIGEINFSWLGLVFGVSGSMLVPLYAIYVKRKLSIVQNNQW